MLEEDAGSAIVWAELASVHSRMQDHKLAEEAARKALRVDPKLAEAHATLGLALYRAGADDERAIGELREAVRLDPGLAHAYTTLGLIYFRRGELQRAQRELSAAIGLNAALPEANFNLAMTFEALAARKGARGNNEREEARRYYRRFLELGTGSPPRHRDYARQALQRLAPADR
jgi:tetratricopeptide (TPR) repeat protein